MRDVIWTIIGIWLIYKLVDMFKGTASKRSDSNSRESEQPLHSSKTQHKEKDIRSAVNKHLNNEGEYVDFEEIK